MPMSSRDNHSLQDSAHKSLSSSKGRLPHLDQVRPHHPHKPVSPASSPLSASAPRFDASAFSQAPVLTPPDSVPMSAEGSLQSGTGMAPQSDARSEPLPGRRDSTGRRESSISEPYPEHARATTTKRKLSESELTASASKRQKSDPSPSLATPALTPALKNAAPLYGVPSKPYPISQPHASQNLFSLFDLDRTAAKVARLDPNTGLKDSANKLRKSYAKHIKDLPGSHEAPKNPGELIHYLEWPHEMYHVERRMNREVESGFPQHLAGKLDKAVQLVTGRLGAEEESRWQGYLAQTDESIKPAPSHTATGAATPSNNARNYSAGTPLGAPSRSRRSGAKRRYDDESFEGYGESFADDTSGNKAGDDEDEGTSTLKKKQRRRVGGASPGSPTRRIRLKPALKKSTQPR